MTYAKKLLLIAFVLLAMFFISSSIITRVILGYRGYRIPTDVMSPMICKGDRIMVNTKAYLKALPERGDIVVFNLPNSPKKMFAKRIIALPGEKLEIKQGNIYINDTLIDTPKIPKSRYYINGKNYAKEGEILEVPKNSYFILGDNSKISIDSRHWGFLNHNNIKGKVIKIYLPLRRISDVE